MNPRRKFLLAAALAGALLDGSSRASAQIVNGTFDGLAGWTVNATDRSFAPMDPSPFVSVTTVGGSSVLQLKNGTYSQNLRDATISQNFTVSGVSPYLQFDFTLPVVLSDGTGPGLSTESDLFTATVFPNADLISVDRDGNINIIGPGFLGVTITSSGTAGMDRTLRADLSQYAGQNVTLVFGINQADDGSYFDPFVDNVAMTAVPEPKHASIAAVMLCAGWTVLRKIRRRPG